MCKYFFKAAVAAATVAAVAWAAYAQAGKAAAGGFTDKRDGSKYRTVKIGEQAWMSENLNFPTGNSKCYGNEESNCRKYGRLYNWNDAAKACPAGWRLPTDEEWTKLENYAGGPSTAGKKLKSKTGWNENGNGTDDYGFSALPGGHGGSGGAVYDVGAGNFGDWWSATKNGAADAWYRNMSYDGEDVYRDKNDKIIMYSVRCVQ